MEVLTIQEGAITTSIEGLVIVEFGIVLLAALAQPRTLVAVRLIATEGKFCLYP